MLSLISAAFLLQSTRTVTLMRGGPGDGEFRYWAVEDTFIDSDKPMENYGRDGLLSGGPKQKILIRFGDLDRMVGRGQKIISAELRLVPQMSRAPKFKSISRVLVPWGEGRGRRGITFGAKTKVAPKNGFDFNANWRFRFGGTITQTWASPGARGGEDAVKIADAEAILQTELVIKGLGPTVQNWLQRPWENNGFALEFTEVTDLASSDYVQSRPQLVLTVGPIEPERGADLRVANVIPKGQLLDAAPATWVATIKNQGDASSGAFSVQWKLNGKSVGSQQRFANGIASGEVVSSELPLAYRRNFADARGGQLTCEVLSDKPDIDPRNDAATIETLGKPVYVVTDKETLMALEGYAREHHYDDATDYLRSVVEFLNETALTQSRFSFAPEGSHERFRFGSLALKMEEPQDGVTIGPKAGEFGLRSMCKQIALASGILDLAKFNFDASQAPPTSEGASKRGSTDLYPGIMGGGDTRDDLLLPSVLGFRYEPFNDPNDALQLSHPTDLFCATDVAQFQANIGRSGAQRLVPAKLLASSLVLKLSDGTGNKLPSGIQLDFYQVAGGRLADKPFHSSTTAAKSELVLIPGRGTTDRNPFGDLDAQISDGLIFMRATYAGTTDTIWIKAWQLIDGRARGQDSAMILPLALNLPTGRVQTDANLAENKVVTSSGNDVPATLLPLVDGKLDTSVSFDEGKCSWIEVDIGRDRPIGEVQIVVDGGIWSELQIRTYATGQRSSEARLWAMDKNTAWTLKNRSDDGATLTYHAAATRSRYVRIFSPANARVHIKEIRIRPSEEVSP